MKRFYPQTWSMESIRPVMTSALKKDVTVELTKIYNKVKLIADKDGDDKSLSVTMGLYTLYKNEQKRKDLMKGLLKCITKHTGIQLDHAILDIELLQNAGASSNATFALHATTPKTAEQIREAVNTKEGFDFFLDVYKIAHYLDRETGKLKKKLNLTGFVCITSRFFDLVYKGYSEIEELTGIILHEIGHIVDSLDCAIRMTCISDLADDIIGYKDHFLTKETAIDLLDKTTQLLDKASTKFNPTLKESAINALISLKNTPESQRDEDWVAVISAVYTMVIREFEYLAGVSIGRQFVSDTVESEDLYKGYERRADKFSAAHGGAKGVSFTLDALVDYVKLSKIYNINHEQAIEIVKARFKELTRDNENYDNDIRRCEELLQNQYLRLSALYKDNHLSELAEELKVIEFLKTTIGLMKTRAHDLGIDKVSFFNTVTKYAGRALTIFCTRNRLSQNSILFRAIRSTARSSIHADAAKLKLLGLEKYLTLPLD